MAPSPLVTLPHTHTALDFAWLILHHSLALRLRAVVFPLNLPLPSVRSLGLLPPTRRDRVRIMPVGPAIR